MIFVDFDIKNNFFLAPMAGITDLAFRTLCRESGAGLCYTEMVSAKALHYNDKKTYSLLKTSPSDTPLVVQIFGSEPEIIAEAVKKIADMGYKMVDINCGCPAPKITSNGEGSALMKSPLLMGEIINKAVKASHIPISIKIRAGYERDNINAVECAKIAEKSGASAVTVHGRTREEFYSGMSDWNIIKLVKENVSIPVIGNGDITSPESAEKMFLETNCDAVMIGRGSLGKPYIFEQILNYYNQGSYKKTYTIEEIVSFLLNQVNLMAEYKNDRQVSLEIRKHIAWYLKGIKHSKFFREEANSVSSISEIKNLCKKILDAYQQT